MTLAGISLLIIALSFAFIAVFVVKTLKAASSTMTSVSNTLEKVEGQMQGITSESENLLKKTNNIASDLEKKTQSINGFVDSLQNVGATMGNVNHTLNGMAESVAHASDRSSDQVAQAMRWGDAAIELYLRWKTKKNNTGKRG
ncbi:DUF948 domain-containing protein [Halobacillus yeomjeoni]|uniref:DUF948 domain-containing protein n=1 Tax=Halobacillus yeomjeoni TaxID=311194 RepID=A0A931HVS4_9BACI|nr:DUF948 domain-containing protein [Halobacillus yeomjeoni]MBH0230316.1 DUF948 domain-containing protein [Halobacillus yeomjeoni]